MDNEKKKVPSNSTTKGLKPAPLKEGETQLNRRDVGFEIPESEINEINEMLKERYCAPTQPPSQSRYPTFTEELRDR